VAHTYNPSTKEAEAGGSKLEALGYVVRSCFNKKQQQWQQKNFLMATAHCQSRLRACLRGPEDLLGLCPMRVAVGRSMPEPRTPPVFSRTVNVQERQKWPSAMWLLWWLKEILKWFALTPMGTSCPCSLEAIDLDLIIGTQGFYSVLYLMQITTTNNIKICRQSDRFGVNCLHFSTPNWTKS
jgi:hypothetical protein